MKHFMSLLEKSMDTDADHLSVNGFDPMTLVVEAAISGAKTGREFRNWLYSLRRYELAGVYVTYEEGKDDYANMTMYQIVRNGDSFDSVPIEINF